tara:strand:- start:6507 stop:8210 length:1704 start_codon:yes stop_codon:yes gene_type:complete
VLGTLVLLSWLFLDTILKFTFEQTLGRLNGAEVNVAEVSHQWSPVRLTLTGVQITDPNQPDLNRVQAERISGDVSLSELILGRVLMEQLDVTGVRLAQKRESPGEVYVSINKDQVKSWASDGWSSVKAKLPSTDEIVAQVGLQTEDVIATAKQKVKQQETEFKQARDQLPKKEKIEQYKQQIEQLTSGKIEGLGDIAERKKQLDKLKQQIRQDKEAVAQFKAELEQSIDTVKTQLSEVKAAPGNDIDRIRSFFQLNETGIQNVTGLLLGEEAKKWSHYVLLAYEQIAPMLARADDSQTIEKARGMGENISFAEQDAAPELLIKKARTEILIAGTQVDVNWENITYQHDLLGQSTTYQARADNASLWRSFNLNGELALLPSGIDAKQQWQLKGAQLSNIDLVNNSEIAASLISSILDSDGSVRVKGNELDGSALVKLLDLKVDASGTSKITKAIANALGQLNRLDVNTDVGGSIVSPSLSLNSDLDDQLGKMLSQAALGEASEKLQSIKQDLMAKVNEQMGGEEAFLNQLGDWQGQSDSLDKQLEELLKSKIEDSLKDKLKGRLFGGS